MPCDQLSGNTWFTTLDLFFGYLQVELDNESLEKTAFSTRKVLIISKLCQMGYVTVLQRLRDLLKMY